MSITSLEWQQQTPAQRLSNKTILRFQNLADELKNDLLRIMPKGIKKVLFVSADRSESRFGKKNSNQRYYNPSCLQTCQFLDGNDVVWQWIRKSIIEGKVEIKEPEWNENRRGFIELFRVASDAIKGTDQFSKFENAVQDNDKKTAHELLIDSISELPYTGFLPSAFDEVAWPCNNENLWQSPSLSFPCCYEVNDKLDQVHMAPFLTNNDSTISSTALNTKETIEGNHIELTRLFHPKFIDDFTIGTKSAPEVNAETPFEKSPPTLTGIFAPVYNFNDQDGKAAGGFEGWIIATTEKDMAPPPSEHHDFVRTAFSLAILNFASKVSQERMRELEERDSIGSTQPKTFTLENFKCIGGWEHETKPLNVSLPEGEVFAYFNDKDTTTLFTSKDKSVPTWEITHIAVRASDEDAPFIFKKRLDTILPATTGYLIHYGIHVARSVKDLYEAARLRHQDRITGSQAAQRAFFHEIRNLGESVHGKWLMKIPQTNLSVVRSILPEGEFIDNHAYPMLAPFPELFEAMSIAFGVWGRKEVFTVKPNDSKLFADTLSAAIEAASSCLTLKATIGKSVTAQSNRQQIRDITKCLQDAREIIKCKLQQITLSNGVSGLSFADPENEKANEHRGLFRRLLVRLVQEAIVHADLDSLEINIIPNVNGKTCDLIWRNKSRGRQINCSDIHTRLNQIGLREVSNSGLDWAMEGTDVLKHLVISLGGIVESAFSRETEDQCFSAKALRIQLK